MNINHFKKGNDLLVSKIIFSGIKVKNLIFLLISILSVQLLIQLWFGRTGLATIDLLLVQSFAFALGSGIGVALAVHKAIHKVWLYANGDRRGVFRKIELQVLVRFMFVAVLLAACLLAVYPLYKRELDVSPMVFLSSIWTLIPAILIFYLMLIIYRFRSDATWARGVAVFVCVIFILISASVFHLNKRQADENYFCGKEYYGFLPGSTLKADTKKELIEKGVDASSIVGFEKLCAPKFYSTFMRFFNVVDNNNLSMLWLVLVSSVLCFFVRQLALKSWDKTDFKKADNHG